ncbi:MAG: 4-hydroxy-tetrahydrodipicolinate reductase [Longicatena sp.]
MINVLVAGFGNMGKLVVSTIEKKADMQVVMIADDTNAPDLSKLEASVDVIIDFSHPNNLAWIAPFVKEHHCAYICGTTGHNELQKKTIEDLGKSAPIVFQANFSLGIAVFQEVLKMITPILEDTYDIEVVEKHHNQKQDAPSGTAKMLVDTMNEKHSYKEIHGRNGFVGKRQKEIGIHAIRGGSVAGEHSVYFFGEDEIFEVKHTANSKQIFVNGALLAARFALQQDFGLYTMKDILFQHLD